MIQSYNKIYHACEIGEIYTPLFAAVEFSYELSGLLERIDILPNLPDMVAAYDSRDLSKIEQAAREHQTAFEKLLCENGVELLAFDTFEEVKAFLDKL